MEPINAKVSVIIPVYNGANFIVEAIESVLKQTHSNVDIIVIDDCSTDNTVAVLTHCNLPITLLNLPVNQGASAARNMGLKHATGDYIAFLDADDLWSPYYIETMLISLQSSPKHDFIYCLHNQINMGAASEICHSKQPTAQVTTLSLLAVFKHPYMATSAMLFKRSMLEHVADFDCNLKTAEDIDFVLRAAEFKPILRLNTALVEVRIRGGSLGQAVNSYKDNIDVIAQFLIRNPQFKIKEMNAITELYEEIYYCWIRELLYIRSFKSFYEQSATALRISPSFRILRLMVKSIPVLILAVFFKK
jgi:glycosyltransferase involved in cell wall biosynthesis